MLFFNFYFKNNYEPLKEEYLVVLLLLNHRFFLAFFLYILPVSLFQLYGNSWFSVADLIILRQLRFLSQEMQRRLRHHKNYLHIYDVLDKR